MHRDLYLVAYDIRDEKRLRRVHGEVVAWATGGQKSAYECFVTDRERDALVAALKAEMDLGEDRAHVVRLRTNCSVWGLGVAVRPQDPTFYYVGGRTG